MRIPSLASFIVLTAAATACLIPAGASAAEPAIGLVSPGDFSPGNVVVFDTGGRVLDYVDLGDAGMGYEPQAIAVRPSTGVAYILSTLDTGGGMADTAGRISTINLTTGAATNLPAGDFASSLADLQNYGMSFDPVTDVLRIVANSDLNLRINPTTGAILSADTALAPAGWITSIAYDRAYASPATTTTAFALDGQTDQIVRIGGIDGAPSPNAGAVSVVGPVGSPSSSEIGIGIAPSGAAFLLGREEDTSTRTIIHSFNLQTAATTRVAGLRPRIDDIAFLPPSYVSLAPTATAAEGSGAAVITVTRAGSLIVPTTVSFTTSNGSATAGSDYVATTSSVTLPVGTSTAQVVVPLIGDGTPEVSEAFTVTLTDSTSSLLGSSVASTVTITDVAPVAPTVDTAAPLVLAVPVSVVGSKSLVKNGLGIRFSCSEGCTASAKLKMGTKTLPVTGSAVLKSAGTGKLTIRLTKASATLLNAQLALVRSHRVALTLTLRFVDAAGNPRQLVLRPIVTR